MNGEAWGIADAAAFVAGIDKDLAATTAENVELVRKGRLTPHESDYVTGLLRDVRSDLAHAFGPLDPSQSYERPDPAVSWRNKVAWMKRELADRRERYPEEIAKGRMTKAEAELRIRVVAALVRLYWNQLFQWRPDAPAAVAYLDAIRKAKGADEIVPLRNSDGARVYRELVRKHLADVDLEENGQRELLVA